MSRMMNSNTVSVIDTATNTVEAATIAVGADPRGRRHPGWETRLCREFSRDDDCFGDRHGHQHGGGGHDRGGEFPRWGRRHPGRQTRLCRECNSNNVSVIDTATNTVEAATLAVGNLPFAVGIIRGRRSLPRLQRQPRYRLRRRSKHDAFTLETSFTLSSTAPAINPVTQAVTLQVGTFAVTLPPGSFNENGKGIFSFEGLINGVTMKALIKHTGTLRYAFQAEAQGASLTGTTNPATVLVNIGGDSAATSVTAMIFH